MRAPALPLVEPRRSRLATRLDRKLTVAPPRFAPERALLAVMPSSLLRLEAVTVVPCRCWVATAPLVAACGWRLALKQEPMFRPR